MSRIDAGPKNAKDAHEEAWFSRSRGQPDVSRGGRDGQQEEAPRDLDLAPREPERPIHAQVILPDLFTTRGRVFVQVDPYRGEVLRAVSFGERSAGLRARVWLRFLHTGEAFGLVGKVAATLASAASLVLVYTGVMLSIHRFFRKGRRRRAQAPMIERKTSEVGGLAESPEVP